MKPRLLLPLLMSAAMLLVPSTAGASISTKAAAAQYLKDVAPIKAAMNKFGAEASKWNNSTTDAQAAKQADPVIVTLRRLQNNLIAQTWPSKAQNDIRVMIRAISPVEASLISLSSLSVIGASKWITRFSSNAAALGLDISYVRHDLGLPLKA